MSVRWRRADDYWRIPLEIRVCPQLGARGSLPELRPEIDACPHRNALMETRQPETMRVPSNSAPKLSVRVPRERDRCVSQRESALRLPRRHDSLAQFQVQHLDRCRGAFAAAVCHDHDSRIEGRR